MQFGISTLSRGLYTSRATYMAVAQAAERAGFAFISVNDHIVVPGKLGSAYPWVAPGRRPSTATASTRSQPSHSSPAAPRGSSC